jgi:hypothetical protein
VKQREITRAGAKGGECCKWKDPGGGANPRVYSKQCCTGEGCTEKAKGTRHAECNWNGELTGQGCKCGEGFGGADCLVQSSKTTCFNGKRSNGDRPGLAACATCYKCQQKLPKVVNGVVVIAGEDRCETLTGPHSRPVARWGACLDSGCVCVLGPEELCLTCGAGAGIVPSGDQEQAVWQVGYRSLGKCQPYPTAVDVETKAPLCVGNCYPRQAVAYAQGKLQVCNKVCSVWNPINVKVASVNVEAAAVCHVAKEDVCHAAAGTPPAPPSCSPSSCSHTSGATLGSLTQPRRCFTKKQLHPRLVCHVMAKSTAGVKYTNGYGTGCTGGAKPAKDLGMVGKGTEKWCCWDTPEGKPFAGSAPAWLKNVSQKQWCSEAALAV